MQQMISMTLYAMFSLSLSAQAEFTVTVVDCLPSMPGDAALGDINGDGRLDLVASLENRMVVQLNSTDDLHGTWSGFHGEAIEWRMHGTSPGLDLGDATGDGITDILLVLPGHDAICILVNEGAAIPSFKAVELPITGEGEGRTP